MFHDQKQILEYKKNDEEAPSHLLTSHQFSKFRENNTRQKTLVLLFLEEIGIDNSLERYGIEHLPMVQEFYDKRYPGMYRIVLIDDGPDPTPLWIGPLGRQYTVALYLEDTHYDGLKSIAAFYGHRKYCPGLGVIP